MYLRKQLTSLASRLYFRAGMIETHLWIYFLWIWHKHTHHQNEITCGKTMQSKGRLQLDRSRGQCTGGLDGGDGGLIRSTTTLAGHSSTWRYLLSSGQRRPSCSDPCRRMISWSRQNIAPQFGLPPLSHVTAHTAGAGSTRLPATSRSDSSPSARASPQQASLDGPLPRNLLSIFYIRLSPTLLPSACFYYPCPGSVRSPFFLFPSSHLPFYHPQLYETFIHLHTSAFNSKFPFSFNTKYQDTFFLLNLSFPLLWKIRVITIFFLLNLSFPLHLKIRVATIFACKNSPTFTDFLRKFYINECLIK